MKTSEILRLYAHAFWIFIVAFFITIIINIASSALIGGGISLVLGGLAYIIVGTFTSAFVKGFFIFGGSLLTLEIIYSLISLSKNVSKFISIVKIRCLDKSYKEVMQEIAVDNTFWKRIVEDKS